MQYLNITQLTGHETWNVPEMNVTRLRSLSLCGLNIQHSATTESDDLAMGRSMDDDNLSDAMTRKQLSSSGLR